MRVASFGIEVEVNVEVVNPGTGQVRADVYTTRSGAGLPPPVAFGFLPPEDGSGRGRGFVGYVIRPRTGLAPGTTIRNVA